MFQLNFRPTDLPDISKVYKSTSILGGTISAELNNMALANSIPSDAAAGLSVVAAAAIVIVLTLVVGLCVGTVLWRFYLRQRWKRKRRAAPKLTLESSLKEEPRV